MQTEMKLETPKPKPNPKNALIVLAGLIRNDEQRKGK
jgi:hypothetical protein